MAASTTPRPPLLRRGGGVAAILAAALAIACLVTPKAAWAQQEFLTFQQQLRPTSPGRSSLRQRGGDPQMLVKANEIDYDYNNNRVAAVGNVQIYYRRATIEADRVVYDQVTKRLRAEGNARLTEANGKVTLGQVIDLTDDYRDGFVDALLIETVAPRRAARQPQRQRSPPGQ